MNRSFKRFYGLLIAGVISLALMAGCGGGGGGGSSSEGTGGSDSSGTVINSAPQIISAPEIFAKADTAYAYTVSAADNENDPLTYSLSTAPSGMAVNPSTGQISWTPTATQGGEIDVTVQVSDGKDTGTQSFKVRVETSTVMAAQTINTCAGGTVEVTDPSSEIYGASISISQDASCADNNVSIAQVSNPVNAPSDIRAIQFAVGTSTVSTAKGYGKAAKSLAASSSSSPVTIKVPIPTKLLSNVGQLSLAAWNEVTQTWDMVSDSV